MLIDFCFILGKLKEGHSNFPEQILWYILDFDSVFKVWISKPKLRLYIMERQKLICDRPFKAAIHISSHWQLIILQNLSTEMMTISTDVHSAILRCIVRHFS